MFTGASTAPFYRRVRAGSFQKPGMFTWNLVRETHLTEDRTLAYSWTPAERAIRLIATDCADRDIIRAVVTAPKGVFEHSFEFLGSVSPKDVSDAFVAEVSALERSRADDVSRSAVALVRDARPEKTPEPVDADLSAQDTALLLSSVAACRLAGVDVSRVRVRVADNLGKNRLGEARLAQAYDPEVWLSRRCLVSGRVKVIGTLLEEHAHAVLGLSDESRELQDYLVDALASAIVRLEEAEARR